MRLGRVSSKNVIKIVLLHSRLLRPWFVASATRLDHPKRHHVKTARSYQASLVQVEESASSMATKVARWYVQEIIKSPP